MAGIKINQYPLERTTFGDEDYYDIDYYTGSSYETAKIKGSVIKNAIASGLVTLYANDGALSGNRAVSGGGTNSLALGNDVASENLSILKINSIQGLEQFANTFPFANAGLEVTKNPGNFIANLKASATDYVKIQLTSDEHRVNSVLGTNNLQQINSSSISSTIVSNGGAGTTARLDLLGSGRVDLGTSGNVGASLVLDSTNSFTDRNATPKGLEYALDYSANYSNRSLVDKEYVDNNAGGGGGILGIADSSGAYTYYATYTLAIAGASAGDTIEQFGNITETGNVTITIPDEVSINMNGYTYTLDGSDNDLFIKNGVGTKTKFINGTIIKQNSPTPNGGGDGLTVTQSAELDCTGLTVISDGTAVLNFNTTSSGQGLITKGNFIYNGTNTGFISSIEGRLDNAFINTGTGIIRVTGDGLYNSTIYGAIATTSAAVLKNCIINNTLASVGLTLSGAKAYNCNVYSQSSNAIFLNNAISECHNSIGKSDSGVGIYIDRGKTYNSTGISTTTVGMFVNQTDAQVSFCTGESSAASGFELRVGNIFNSVGKSTYNNALGHGIYAGNNNGTVSNCTGITVNASAHAIQAGTVNRNIKISNLKGKGMTTLIGNKAINIQTNTADNFGNLLIG